ncbi:hypothetical protein BCR33DRAFT_728271 [Rhizoclosmatium globosum]|uniref:Uncharacterized protein n=1 Tax=Rhizoclosmatium globosum TaxID=329046 RepID=A0A1Y2AKK9_9FUNG|nr:hypothetical protein BCR33DRAFT_728271 [Rhizoclosmatium globosum]|eukprot:ORY23081.1 hypothetical protein BCR33DRAFT_728271 [Rhizoclosmatium globosum]
MIAGTSNSNKYEETSANNVESDFESESRDKSPVSISTLPCRYGFRLRESECLDNLHIFIRTAISGETIDIEQHQNNCGGFI